MPALPRLCGLSRHGAEAEAAALQARVRFKRVTNGFREMPSWKEVYSREERMAVVTYVLSKEFSP